MISRNLESPIKDHSRSTFLTGMEFATLKKEKFILEISITEKPKLIMEPLSILMAPTMKGASKIPTSMAMVPFNIRIKH